MPLQGSMRRRRETDLIKLIGSGREVTMLGQPHEFCVKFKGPSNTPYEGGIWNVRMHLTEDYPFKSPSVGFMNRIFHPNIDERSGSICLDVLNQAWTPLYDLTVIVEVFLPQLLTEPNPDDPLNSDAANLLIQKPDEYKEVVKKHVSQFATEVALEGESESSSLDSEPDSVSNPEFNVSSDSINSQD